MHLDTCTNLLIVYSHIWLQASVTVKLDQWRQHSNDSENVSDDLINWCGTEACAIGHATSNPVLKMQGFTFDWKRGVPEFNPSNPHQTLSEIHDFPADGWDAVRVFFKIPLFDAECIFAEHDPRPTYWYEESRETEGTYEQIRGKKDSELHLDDRRKVLRRIRLFLKSREYITKAEAKVLKKSEKPAE